MCGRKRISLIPLPLWTLMVRLVASIMSVSTFQPRHHVEASKMPGLSHPNKILSASRMLVFLWIPRSQSVVTVVVSQRVLLDAARANSPSELGHIAKSCKDEKKERERIQIKCVNCGEVGHRARDCTQQRVNRFACRNCK